MSSVPFMQLYPADYLADTLDLTTEQHGAYLLILLTMWSKGASLPNDPVKLARIARMTPAKFRATWAEISRFFEDDGATITNPRMSRDWEKTQQKITKLAKAGKAGGAAKALKDKEARLANAMPMPCQLEPEPELEKKEGSCEPLSVSPTLPAVQAGPSFDDFWAVWPLAKTAKQAARTAYARLSPANRSLAVHRAHEWAETWRRLHPQASDIHPATYLNKRRWEDETPTLTLIPGGPHDQSTRHDRNATARTDALRDQLDVAGRMRRTSQPNWL